MLQYGIEVTNLSVSYILLRIIINNSNLSLTTNLSPTSTKILLLTTVLTILFLTLQLLILYLRSSKF